MPSLTSFRTTLAAVVLDYLGLYCEQTYSPRWGAVWASA